MYGSIHGASELWQLARAVVEAAQSNPARNRAHKCQKRERVVRRDKELRLICALLNDIYRIRLSLAECWGFADLIARLRRSLPCTQRASDRTNRWSTQGAFLGGAGSGCTSALGQRSSSILPNHI